MKDAINDFVIENGRLIKFTGHAKSVALKKERK